MIQAFITGNIGKDAELRQAGSDNVCSFSVASNRKAKGNDVTTWVSCSIWGKRGDALVQYLKKGTKVAVSGELSTREHNGKTYLELRVNEIDLMGGGQRQDRPAPSHNTGGGYDDAPPDDSDIPF